MSRSYKKTPRSGDTKDKFFKRYANRKLRRKKLTHGLQHKSYKKDFCYYDICDYESVGTTFEEFYAFRVSIWSVWDSHYGKEYPTREEAYQEYMKWFKRK